MMFHSRSKHIELRYHWIRDVLKRKELVLEKIHTSEKDSDMLTKPIPPMKLETYCEKTYLVGGVCWVPYSFIFMFYLFSVICNN
jgi:hypothetical protein